MSRVAALDYGKARIGVAVSDELGMLAHPRAPLDARRPKDVDRALAELVREDGVTRFLVGLPRNLSGTDGTHAEEARAFAQRVADVTGCDVELVDERWTTTAAKRELRASGVSSKKERPLVDGVAASLMLQAWLDRSRNGPLGGA